MLFDAAESAVYAAAKGMLHPLESYFGTAESANRADSYPGALNAVSALGHVWAVPLSFAPMVLAYDPATFAEAGVAPPAASWGWDEMAVACSELTSARAKRYALGPFDSLPNYVYQAGGSILTSDGTHSALTEPAALAGFSFYQELVQMRKVAAPRGGFTEGPPRRYGDNRVALWAASIFDGVRPLNPYFRYGPPVHAKANANAALASSVLTVTHAARDPRRSFAAVMALADAVQPRLIVPTRSIIAKQQSAQLYGGDEARSVILSAAAGARAEPLDVDMFDALGMAQQAIVTGVKDAAQAAMDSGSAIDRVLNDHYASATA